MKFKNGQHVKLRLSTNPASIYLKDKYAEGIIVADGEQDSLKIKLIPPSNLDTWWIESKYIQLAHQKGEQLLFAFMNE